MTIRRDLTTTVRPSFCSAAILFWNRAGQPLSVKRSKIPPGGRKTPGAKLAATLVEPDQTLFFDCGTPRRGLLKRLIMKYLSPPFVIAKYLSGAERETPLPRISVRGEFHASNAIFKPIDFQQTLKIFARISLFILRRACMSVKAHLF